MKNSCLAFTSSSEEQRTGFPVLGWDCGNLWESPPTP